MPEEEASVKKVPKKRVAKKAIKKVAKKAATRTVRRAPAKSAEKAESVLVAEPIKRAAPTAIKPKKKGMSFGFVLITFVVLLSSAATAVYVGYTAEGQIDVALQAKKNAGVNISGQVSGDTPTPAPTNNLPNGGLERATISENLPNGGLESAISRPQTNATSTDAAASTTPASISTNEDSVQIETESDPTTTATSTPVSDESTTEDSVESSTSNTPAATE